MHDDYLVGRPQAADALKILTDESYAKEHYGFPEWRVMQFTGLHDKNGKEIYEGDIVIWHYGYLWWNKGPGQEKFTVEWDDGGFNFFEPDAAGELSRWPDQCEVIGNIHENADLLSKK